MGFGYEDLKKLNKQIVMVNVSAYGQYGPFRDRVGFDTIGQAMSGLMSLTGPPEGDPTVQPFPLIDRITSLHATIGALGALYERQRYFPPSSACPPPAPSGSEESGPRAPAAARG